MRSTRAPSHRESPLERAVRLLAGRDFTAAELESRLARAGVAPQERTDVLESLARAGYLDDGRVVCDRASRLAARGQGDSAIRLDLASRGASPELVEQAIASLEPEGERAERLADQLGRTPKTARTLSRKGFSEDSIERLLMSVAQDP